MSNAYRRLTTRHRKPLFKRRTRCFKAESGKRRGLLGELDAGSILPSMVVPVCTDRLWPRHKVHGVECNCQCLQITRHLFTDHKTLSGHVEMEGTNSGQGKMSQRSNFRMSLPHPKSDDKEVCTCQMYAPDGLEASVCKAYFAPRLENLKQAAERHSPPLGRGKFKFPPCTGWRLDLIVGGMFCQRAADLNA